MNQLVLVVVVRLVVLRKCLARWRVSVAREHEAAVAYVRDMDPAVAEAHHDGGGAICPAELLREAAELHLCLQEARLRRT